MRAAVEVTARSRLGREVDDVAKTLMAAGGGTAVVVARSKRSLEITVEVDSGRVCQLIAHYPTSDGVRSSGLKGCLRQSGTGGRAVV